MPIDTTPPIRGIPEIPEPCEERLEQLAAAVGPLRHVLGALAERLIATGAHARLGYARIGDYARERLGLSARQLQELARVSRALAGLPRLEAALLANALPWSKVRLVARVADVDDESAWIARACTVSTRCLEAEVRAPARDDDEPTTRLRLRCPPALRERWLAVRELAERVAGRRLRNGDALELVVAEGFAALSIDPAFAGWVDAAEPLRRMGRRDPPRDEPTRRERSLARALPEEVSCLTGHLADADAAELDRRLRRAVRLEQTLDAAIAPLLRRVACAEHAWRETYQPLARYAPERLGMSASRARALIRLERAGDVCPELREAYRGGRISWVKAQCLLPLLLLDVEGGWRSAWVAWAQRVTVRRLERDVERALLLRAAHHCAWQRCKFHPERAQDPIPPDERQLCAHDVDPEATEELVFRVPHAVAALYRAVLETARQRLPPEGSRPLHDSEVFDALLDAATLAWMQREPGVRRPDPVIERDGYACAIPGCTSRRALHDHHVVFRSQGGSDAAWNRVTLCAFHHQRGVHAGLLRVTGRAPDDLVFDLPLSRYVSGDREVPRTRTWTRPQAA